MPRSTSVVSSACAFSSALPLHSGGPLTARSASICGTSTRRFHTSFIKRTQPRTHMQFPNLLRALFAGSAEQGVPTAEDMHAVLRAPLATPESVAATRPNVKSATFGLGCFWGAERKFWQAKGVLSTSVGYSGGDVKNPTYRQVCSGRTGHAEVVNVLYDENETSYEKLLDVFWDSHDPTTLNRQGNDVGTQYRSIIMYYDDEQKRLAEETRDHFNRLLRERGLHQIVTQIESPSEYYLAERYHQQYLHKNPLGYCGLGGTGVYRPRTTAAK